MDKIDRKKLVSPCFLDTVLQFSGWKLNPILKFHSLFVRHFVISDTQALDNCLFQTDPLVENLPYLFEDCSYDGLPLIVVLKRRPAGFEELLLNDMLRIDKGGQHGMELSCLGQQQTLALRRLRENGTLNKRTLTDIGYPFEVLEKIDKHVSVAEYDSKLGSASFVYEPDRYRSLIYNLLKLDKLPIQFGLETAIARSVLKRVTADDPEDPLSISKGLGLQDSMGRTHVYRWRSRMRKNRVNNRELKRLPNDDFEKLLSGIVSCADFAYLRNFSDSCGTSIMIDNLHWLPSSVVNQSFSRQLPVVERADAAIEHLLDIKDGSFEGYSSEHWLSIHKQLDKCGFSNEATWEKIANLRRSRAFCDRLLVVEEALDKGNTSDACNLLREHVIACCKTLVPSTTYSWHDLFPPVLGMVADYLVLESSKGWKGVVSFAMISGLAFLPIAGKALSIRRNRTLINCSAASVCDLLLENK
jgi:hypothetical protein